MTSSLQELWLPFGHGSENAEARLFCLPFSGGGASNFLGLQNSFAHVGLAPIQYPGHETRFDEPLIDNIDEMLDGLTKVIAPLLDRPYMLFGYSMGAKLAFELTKRFERGNYPPPLQVFIAAHLPPDRVSPVANAVGLPDIAFKEVVREYGGVPDDLFDDEEFCAMALPVLRADFSLASQPIGTEPISCPIIAYAGTGDHAAPPAAMGEWSRFTKSRCRTRTFSGGHFFFREAADFQATMSADIASALRVMA